MTIRNTRPTIPPPTANRLLAALPAAEYQSLAPHLLRFTHALITQMAQTAVCNGLIRLTNSYAAGFC